METLPARIARRLKALREEREMTQEALAGHMGFGSRQTLAKIEAGERALSAEELVRAASGLQVDPEVLMDPYRLTGEGRFSFRTDHPETDVASFEDQAGRWVATYRILRDRAGVPSSYMSARLDLHERSSFEAAEQASEELRRTWNLGDVPSEALEAAIERELGARVLHFDEPTEISGAAINLPGLHVILVNRHEIPGRRSFDLAHELFHVLTWDAMPPDPVEAREPPPTRGKRPEQLANCFASALLTPGPVVLRRWSERAATDLHDWLNHTAHALGVTSDALRWRLVSLGALSKRDADALNPVRLRRNGGIEDAPPPPVFNREFMELVYNAVENGDLSLRRASRLLGLSLSAMGAAFRSWGLNLSYEV
jgi:Zn-dependent peptidase ImmA (M78 family)/DNA-binding XRE family transcriptional regulator